MAPDSQRRGLHWTESGNEAEVVETEEGTEMMAVGSSRRWIENGMGGSC